jgi:hypothetical protein
MPNVCNWFKTIIKEIRGIVLFRAKKSEDEVTMILTNVGNYNPNNTE